MECPIRKWAETAPERPALTSDGRTYSYSALNNAIEAQIPLFLPNQVYLLEKVDVITLFAIFRAKACAFPLNWRLPEKALKKWTEEYQGIQVANNIGTLLLTSGTTSAPKIACHSFENYLMSAQLSYPALSMSQESRTLVILPLFHVGGIVSVFRSFVSGGLVVIPESKNLNEEIKLHQITHLSAVPTQLPLLQNTRRPLTILIGGTKCPKALLSTVSQHTTLISYGMTETTAMIFCNGRPLPGVFGKLDETGKCYVKTPTIFQGYLKNGRIEPPCLYDGYLCTEDRAQKRNNRLEILGRADRMFISGGENIQPGEIESLLESHAKIEKAIVKPKKDTKFGEVPVAYIHPMCPAEDLVKFLLERLPKYKIPRAFYPISDLGGKYGINF